MRESSDCRITTLGPGSRPLRGLGRDDGSPRFRRVSAKIAHERGINRRRAVGFSLIEVLAAFVILALVGTALFRLFSGALGNAALAEEYSRATLYAESRLATYGVETPYREAVEEGTSEDGRYAWTATISPYSPPSTSPDLEGVSAAMPVRLWRIAVTVRWPGTPGNDRSVSLSTLRVAIKE